MKCVKCKHCKWVHFELVSPEALAKCFKCGGSYENFEDAEEKDLPQGSTIQPILARSKDNE